MLTNCYSISARDYVERALIQLSNGSHASLFYAAFELRCGIEARLEQYFEASKDISKNKKAGWRIDGLHRDVNAAFKIGSKYARWAIHDAETGEMKYCFYYTPVTPMLKKRGEKLGNYLHSAKIHRASNDPWWGVFRVELEMCLNELALACSGTLLGPIMMKYGSDFLNPNLEIPTEYIEQVTQNLKSNSVVTCKISYPEVMPDPIETKAVFWKTSRKYQHESVEIN